MSDFGKDSTADEVLDGIDLSGRTVFVTGGNSGLGKEAARAMAQSGAHIVLAGRDADALDEAVGDILREVKGAHVDTMVCDLASLASVEACAREASERFDRIDVLMNNAGIMACPFGHTADGFERQLGTNHIGHFALTEGLLPLLEKGDAPRIVVLSSLAHIRSDIDWDDPHFERREYDKQVAYGQSKTANALHAVALDARLKDRGIRAASVHPGGIVTNLGRHLTDEDRTALMARMAKLAEAGMAMKTVPQGAATQVWAATRLNIEAHGGAYCENCRVAEVKEESIADGVRPYAIDPAAAERLWGMTEDMIAAARR